MHGGLDQRLHDAVAHTFALDRTIHWAWRTGYEYFMLGGGMEPKDVDISISGAVYRI